MCRIHAFCSVPARGSQVRWWTRARQLPLQRRQHQPAHRRLDRRRLPQPDGADCAIGAQQHGEVSGRAELVSAAVVAAVTLELHQYQARRQQRRNLCRLHQPRLDLWQLAVELLLQLPLRASSAWLRWMSCSRPWRFSRVNSASSAPASLCCAYKKGICQRSPNPATRSSRRPSGSSGSWPCR